MVAEELATEVITIDTSALFALLNRRDADHDRTRQALLDDRGPYLVPIAILSEIAYLVESRMPAALDPFLADLELGAYGIECGASDLARIRELVARYADLPLGVADAAVIACAERNGGHVLTLDARHFGTVAREGTITVSP